MRHEDSVKIPAWEYTGISVKWVHFWTFFKVRSLSENILELCGQLKYGLLPKMISVWKSLLQVNIFNWFTFPVCDSKTSSKHSLIFVSLISLKKPNNLLIQKFCSAQVSSGKLSQEQLALLGNIRGRALLAILAIVFIHYKEFSLWL